MKNLLFFLHQKALYQYGHMQVLAILRPREGHHNGPPIFSLKTTLRTSGSGPIKNMVPLGHPIQQLERHRDRFSLFC